MRATVVVFAALAFLLVFEATPASGCGCEYDYAGTTCSTGPTSGARNLASYLKRTYGSRQEIYNCRKIRGGGRLSLHAEGRAVDHYISGPAGTALFNSMIAMACQNGIQEVIFNRKIWTRSGIRAYHGANPHTNHVHIGLNRCGARAFRG